LFKSEVKGVVSVEQTVNMDLQKIEEQYGSELAELLKENMEFCHENKWNYKIEVIEESERFITFAFSTNAYTYLFEIQISRKRCVEKNFFGRQAAIKALELMNSLQ
jgi:hypothetical protein